MDIGRLAGRTSSERINVAFVRPLSVPMRVDFDNKANLALRSLWLIVSPRNFFAYFHYDILSCDDIVRRTLGRG